MKRILVAAIIGLAAVASVKGQGQVFLYSYGGDPGRIIYGNHQAGGTPGTGVVNPAPYGGGNWSVGLYYVNGAFASTANTEMAGDLGMGYIPPYLALSSAVTTFITGYPGQFGNSGSQQAVTIPGNTGAAVATFVVVVYNGSSYATSTIRGHSPAFQMSPAVSPNTPPDIGLFMPTWLLYGMPEPSTFALGVLVGMGVWLKRRHDSAGR